MVLGSGPFIPVGKNTLPLFLPIHIQPDPRLFMPVNGDIPFIRCNNVVSSLMTMGHIPGKISLDCQEDCFGFSMIYRLVLLRLL